MKNKEKIIKVLKTYHLANAEAMADSIEPLIDNENKRLLSNYTDFLLRHGYTDTDVYDEPPTAIDQFLGLA